MGNRLYVGNLPFKITEGELEDLFSTVGAIGSVRIITDRDTGRARGFGFVGMVQEEDAQKAIEKFNEYELDGRSLTVNEARPRQGGGGGGGGGRGGGGGYRREEPRW